MIKLVGLFVGGGVVPPEERQSGDGSTYMSRERYVVCLASGEVNDPPQFHNCESRAVLDAILGMVSYNQPVELVARRGQYGRIAVTGLSSALRAG